MVQGEGEGGGSVALYRFEGPGMAHFLNKKFLKW